MGVPGSALDGKSGRNRFESRRARFIVPEQSIPSQPYSPWEFGSRWSCRFAARSRMLAGVSTSSTAVPLSNKSLGIDQVPERWDTVSVVPTIPSANNTTATDTTNHDVTRVGTVPRLAIGRIVSWFTNWMFLCRGGVYCCGLRTRNTDPVVLRIVAKGTCEE